MKRYTPAWLNEHVPLYAVRCHWRARHGHKPDRPDIVALVLSSKGVVAAKDAAAHALPARRPYKADIVTRPLVAMDIREVEQTLSDASRVVKRSPLRVHKVNTPTGCLFVLTKSVSHKDVRGFAMQCMPGVEIVSQAIVTSPFIIADYDAAGKAADGVA